tara:strand:- start:1396 stop:1773 length:378 start_codon:yes stop_codon:yes gene_type:complete
MGGCVSKKKNKEERNKLVEKSNINKYLFKYKCIITNSFLDFNKNDEVNILLYENDLVLQNHKMTYSILYNNIVNWANYGNYYWNLSFVYHRSKKQHLLFAVIDSKNISENLEEITQKIKLEYKDL